MISHFAHYNNAIALRDRILSGRTNETAVMAWAGVCRQCALAQMALIKSLNGESCTRLDLSFMNNLEAIWWIARAQREHHAANNLAKLAA